MKKWKQLPTIVAKRHNAKTPDRYLSEFQQQLQSWATIHPNGIRAYYWTITYAKRELPKVDIIILWHRRATVALTACITAALQQAFEDNATLTVAVTSNSKAFRRIVAHRRQAGP
jgi:protein involved in sex pheromone biosynthesis